MDSLKIQDAFEPYYAGRNRVAATARRLPAKTENSLTKEQTESTSPTSGRLSDRNKPDSTTEH
ncbi:hypothetical protein EN943_28990 [Mesorhizobium sp. M7A.F.Ca.US.006.01.1.1]|uniref:hypothetical protein n=1 Tax=Mesorhizobium sp. M7A.F.Ca.US.006.01.1.1 TaxID=2496707 RepID=UPI000FC9D473|nr:hypothetical protein [Mesorhizobium sp. M7A.F.Ca.US.006.01.1.1]RUZ72879.1 hypothetical protein EN943_28990 [Mesorhizobium sp. M7A.F.Ca.US.006.01.1.1]